jgi:RNA polymerase sigma factor for flagellar operon FliA
MTRLTDDQRTLVEKNLDLAHFLARESWGRNRESIVLEEVVAVAYEGLIKAALKFDPSRMSEETVASGKAFSSFARQRIMGAILDWQREMDHVPRAFRQTYKKMRAAGYGDTRTLPEVAIILEESEARLHRVARAVENPSTYLDDDFDQPSDHDVESSALEKSIRDGIAETFSEMDYQTQVILSLRYYENWELRQIAQELGLALTTVYTMHAEAVVEIHRSMASRAHDQAG